MARQMRMLQNRVGQSLQEAARLQERNLSLEMELAEAGRQRLPPNDPGRAEIERLCGALNEAKDDLWRAQAEVAVLAPQAANEALARQDAEELRKTVRMLRAKVEQGAHKRRR